MAGACRRRPLSRGRADSGKWAPCAQPRLPAPLCMLSVPVLAAGSCAAAAAPPGPCDRAQPAPVCDWSPAHHWLRLRTRSLRLTAGMESCFLAQDQCQALLGAPKELWLCWLSLGHWGPSSLCSCLAESPSCIPAVPEKMYSFSISPPMAATLQAVTCLSGAHRAGRQPHTGG